MVGTANRTWCFNMRYTDSLRMLWDKSPTKVKSLMRFGYEKVIILGESPFRNLAVKKLREMTAKCNTIDEKVDLAFSFKITPFKFFNIRPSQIKWEISQLMKILTELAPETVLEIGTGWGGTLYLWTRVATPDATLISIDLPGGPFGGGYPKWRVPFFRSFASIRQRIHLLRMNSHDETTLHEVKRILGGSKLDFLFIDGDHTYEGVKKDFEMYSPLVRGDGIIAFHDIVEHPPETGCEVHRFWREIKNNYPHQEIVKDWNQGWAGIGVILKEKQVE